MLFVAFQAQASPAKVWSVCNSLACDFPTIQQAVNAAADGDKISLIAPSGVHTEAGIVVNKSLTILGNGNTVQAAASRNIASNRVFLISGAHTVTISNMTVRYGKATAAGGAIANIGGDVILRDVNVRYSDAPLGGGISNGSGSMLLDRVYVAANGGNDGGGISNGGHMTMQDSTVVINDAIDRGAGLYSTGTLTVTGSRIYGNHTTSMFQYNMMGGGIFATGNSTLINTEIYSNSVTNSNFSGGQGAGIHFNGPGRLELIDSDIHGNDGSVGAFGGGLSVAGGWVFVSGTTFYNNKSIDGGGIHICGSGPAVSITNSTISGNDASNHGGGVFVCSTAGVSLYNATISDNNADSDAAGGGRGGGIYLETIADASGSASLRNTIVAGNRYLTSGIVNIRTPECYGVIDSQGYNLLGSLGINFAVPANRPCLLQNSSTDVIDVNHGLQPLADNGGPTLTHGLGSLSPAINGGNPAGCLDGSGHELAADQRGAMRNGRCDIGAFEYHGLTEHVYLPAVLK